MARDLNERQATMDEATAAGMLNMIFIIAMLQISFVNTNHHHHEEAWERYEIRTIEIDQEEDSGNYVGDECDEEVDDALPEKKLPQRRPAGRHYQSNCRKYQDDQVKRHR